MTSAYQELLARLQVAYDTLQPGCDPALRASDRCDYQSNGVMSLAKALSRPPRDVASDLVDCLDVGGLAEVEVAGPGFLNLTLTDRFLSRHLNALAIDDRLGIHVETPKTVVIDYSSPNVAKEMHVGHLRTTVIGDSLRRIKEFAGHHVIGINHIGDWGTPFGMLIEHLVDLGEQRAMTSLSMGDLDSFYRDARSKFDSDSLFAERSRQRVVLLQSGDAGTLRLWGILVEQSITYFDEVYRKLDVKLSSAEVIGESFYNDRLAGVVADLDSAGLLQDSEGAKCVFPPGFINREGEPLPLIVQKRDEGFGYAATDLASLRYRVTELGADEMYYVVGATQSQHFDMVFATARLAGWLPDDVRCEHVGFGNVLGLDRKIMKSRSGEPAKLVSLLDEAIERSDRSLAERDAEMNADSRRQLATLIARAAIKYADLSTERKKDYVFDLDRMVAFEGDTGPYLAYAYARVRSIFRKLDEPWTPISREFHFEIAAERELATGLLGLSEVFELASDQLAPNKLCNYLFDVAQRFTSFYEQCPVLSAPLDQRDQRLMLCDLVGRTLELGLSLLGIEVPERM